MGFSETIARASGGFASVSARPRGRSEPVSAKWNLSLARPPARGVNAALARPAGKGCARPPGRGVRGVRSVGGRGCPATPLRELHLLEAFFPLGFSAMGRLFIAFFHLFHPCCCGEAGGGGKARYACGVSQSSLHAPVSPEILGEEGGVFSPLRVAQGAFCFCIRVPVCSGLWVLPTNGCFFGLFMSRRGKPHRYQSVQKLWLWSPHTLHVRFCSLLT